MKYFAYGMNTNHEEMAHRCPQAHSLGHAVLYGHQFRFSRHADILVNDDDYVDGVLWDITPGCESALDILEGYPRYYEKKTVKVLHRGQMVEAMTYYMTGDLLDQEPSNSYLAMIMDGYHRHGVPTDQVHTALDRVKYYNDAEYAYVPWEKMQAISG